MKGKKIWRGGGFAQKVQRVHLAKQMRKWEREGQAC